MTIIQNSVEFNSNQLFDSDIARLHSKKTEQKKMNMSNCKAVKKTIMIIKNIEKKSMHFKKKNDQKINDLKKRKRNNDVFDKKSSGDRFNVVIEFNRNVKKNKNNKKNKKKFIENYLL